MQRQFGVYASLNLQNIKYAPHSSTNESLLTKDAVCRLLSINE